MQIGLMSGIKVNWLLLGWICTGSQWLVEILYGKKYWISSQEIQFHGFWFLDRICCFSGDFCITNDMKVKDLSVTQEIRLYQILYKFWRNQIKSKYSFYFNYIIIGIFLKLIRFSLTNRMILLNTSTAILCNCTICKYETLILSALIITDNGD